MLDHELVLNAAWRVEWRTQAMPLEAGMRVFALGSGTCEQTATRLEPSDAEPLEAEAGRDEGFVRMLAGRAGRAGGGGGRRARARRGCRRGPLRPR